MQIKIKQEEQTITQDMDIFDDEYQYLLDLNKLLVSIDPDGAPTMSVLEAWKDKYKNIYVSTVIEPNKYYLWRTIRRGEFKKLESEGMFEKASSTHEALVERCLLYPQSTPEWRLTASAGIIDTLGKQISYQSGWISEQEAFSSIRVV